MTTPKPNLQPIAGGRTRKRGVTLEERAAAAKRKLDEAKAEYDAVCVQIRESYPVGTKAELDHITVTVAENKTLDKVAAAIAYPGEEYQELGYTAASLKRKLNGEQYDALQKRGEPKVTITLKAVTG